MEPSKRELLSSSYPMAFGTHYIGNNLIASRGGGCDACCAKSLLVLGFGHWIISFPEKICASL